MLARLDLESSTTPVGDEFIQRCRMDMPDLSDLGLKWPRETPFTTREPPSRLALPAPKIRLEPRSRSLSLAATTPLFVSVNGPVRWWERDGSVASGAWEPDGWIGRI